MHPFAIGPGADRRSRLGLLLAVALLAMAAAAKPIVRDRLDPDCFWHLRVGEQLLHDGIGPLIDHLSFGTVQTPWAPSSWLADIALTRLWIAGGYRAAIAVQAALQALFVCFLAAACQARLARSAVEVGPRGPGAANPGALRAAAATLFGIILAFPYLTLRPVTAALVVMTGCAWLIVRDRRQGETSRAIWCVIPLTALGINLHLYALFIPLWFFALLLGAFWERRTFNDPAARAETDRRLERSGALFLGVGLACLATPMLPGVIGTAIQYCFNDPMAGGTLDRLQTFFWTRTGQLAGVAVLGLLVCAIWNRSRLRAGEIIWLSMSLLIWLRAGRTAPVLVLGAAPVLAATLPVISDRLLGQRLVCFAMASVLIVGVWKIARAFPKASEPLTAWLNRPGRNADIYPCGAADFVAERLRPNTGRLINEYTWGGYLEWRLGDNYQTLLDGRTQLFAPEMWQATELATPGERKQFLGDVQADAAVLPARNSIFHDPLMKLGWRVAYRDNDAEVLSPPTGKGRRTGEWPTADLFFGDGR